MGPAPERPAIRLSQQVPVSFPTGEMTPVPVTNTRRPFIGMSRPSPWMPGCPRRTRSSASRRRGGTTGGDGPGLGSLRARVGLQVVHRVADGLELVRVLVGDVEPELLLERHHELHDVERVRAEVLDELGLRRELLGIDLELLRD